MTRGKYAVRTTLRREDHDVRRERTASRDRQLPAGAHHTRSAAMSRYVLLGLILVLAAAFAFAVTYA